MVATGRRKVYKGKKSITIVLTNKKNGRLTGVVYREPGWTQVLSPEVRLPRFLRSDCAPLGVLRRHAAPETISKLAVWTGVRPRAVPIVSVTWAAVAGLAPFIAIQTK